MHTEQVQYNHSVLKCKYWCNDSVKNGIGWKQTTQATCSQLSWNKICCTAKLFFIRIFCTSNRVQSTHHQFTTVISC